MSKNLVIVESPGKVAVITKYLNNNPNLKDYGKFVVTASFGHIRDLKKKELGVLVDKDFKPIYEIVPDKQKLVNELKTKARESDQVWLASDYDREGEAIAMHIRDALNLKDKYKRITFTEITSKALENAIKHPRKIDEDLVDAQETRRILDRLVGFSLSPLLWKKFTGSTASGFSAGRVQSAVLDLIIHKERDISQFISSSYWSINGTFKLKMSNVTHDLEEVKLYCNGTVCKYDDINNVKTIFKNIKNQFNIVDVKTKTSNQYPDLPFITSSLQQEAYSKLGMPVKRTMQIAQDLYESGMITYMRTDSHNVSEDFQKNAIKYIVDTYGQSYWESAGPKKQKVVKNAQEAHECIRPVSVERATVKGENSKFTKEHERLYELIWKRTVAYFMKACTYDELEIYIREASFQKDMFFITSFKKVKFNGYMILYGIQNDKYDFSKYVASLKAGDADLTCEKLQGHNTWTTPPARYNESSLVKTLENEGLGRPSTYSSILQKLIDKQYVIKSDVKGVDKEALHLHFNPKTKVIKEELAKVTVGAEKTRIVPTDIGIEIDKYLGETFNYILDKKFTANMEADLDRIANGQKTGTTVLTSFWTPFKKDLDKYGKIAKSNKVEIKTESNEFTIKGKKYIVRIARYGPVIEYESVKGEKSYIPLKEYLRYVGKEYTDIEEKDIKLLTRLPFAVAEVNGKPIELNLGRYGLYLKYGENNIKITLRMIKEFLDTGEFNVADIKKSLEYYKERQSSESSTKKQPSAKHTARHK